MNPWKTQLMKKGPIVCIILGILLIGVGFSIVDFDLNRLKSAQPISFVKKEQSVPLDSISQIQLLTTHSEVSIVATKEDQIIIHYEENDDYPIHISTTSNRLQIERKTPNMSFQWFSFNNDISIPIRIEVPVQYLGGFDISSSYGEVSVTDFTAGDLLIENDHGDVKLTNLQAGSALLDAPYGEISLNNVTIDQTLNISNDHGTIQSDQLQALALKMSCSYSDITMDNTTIIQDFELENQHSPINLGTLQAYSVEVESSYGDVSSKKLVSTEHMTLSSQHSEWTINELIAEGLEMENTYGDITIPMLLVKNIDMNAEHGSIDAKIKGSIDDFVIVTEADHGENSLPTNYQNGGNQKLHIITTYGDINIKFIR